jgi:ABC-type Fe3+/spermidine/putrescine transport system ATPase subunit
MPNVMMKGISKAFGSIVALRDVNLDVHEGEYLSIVGPSGCGKTTLIKAIAGIVKPDDGDVYIDGRPVTALPIEDRGVGYVFQEIALFPQMTVRENVSYGPMVKGVPPERARGQVMEMLEMMSLSDRASSSPHELSGGARQKTAVARALASGSSLLLLDEPLGSLDLKVRTALRYEIRELVKDLGLTAIHVTHDQEEALSISDRVAVMKAGGIVEVGLPRELYMRPRRLFTAKFLGEANFMEGKIVESARGEYIVEVVGLRLRAQSVAESELRVGGAVVLAIRPEFIGIVGRGNGSKLNRVGATVKSVAFAGDVEKYEVETENGIGLTVKHLPSLGGAEIKSGDDVLIEIRRDHLLVYKYPEDGLERELSLE